MSKLNILTALLLSVACIAALTVFSLPPAAPENTQRWQEPPLNAIRAENLTHYKSRPITDDIMYFVLPDRFNNGDTSNDHGGFKGGRRDHGFDPTHKGFFHGGDLRGLTEKLDYIADMGMTAIWLTPIFKNKPTQGGTQNYSSGYHGYWVTDFTQIDPHLGSNDDLKALVKEAHKRNIKVIFDIIANHTADVIKYRECNDEKTLLTVPQQGVCDYRSRKDYPYTTKGGPSGPALNQGFLDDAPTQQTAENFDKLTDPNFAYTPYVPKAEKNVKVPAWLNDPIYYHNRGDTHWSGESDTYGDFSGLDDLYTEHPRVQQGMIDIFKFWVSEFKIDGFRIDTVRHVNDSFWQKFAPAIKAHASAEGIPNFYIFGEASLNQDNSKTPTEKLSHYMHNAGMPAVLDFGFQAAAKNMLAGRGGPLDFSLYFAQDHLYQTKDGNAGRLPTFLGNHDDGRIGYFIKKGNPDLTPEQLLDRSKLAHAIMYFTRGVPVVYYGDEQGFTGDGRDQDAREDMFPSKVQSYNDNLLLGSDQSTANDNFDVTHVLYQHMQNLAAIKRAHPALTGGAQKMLFSNKIQGLLALQRTDKASNRSLVVVFNGSAKKATSLKGSVQTLLTSAPDLCLLGASDKDQTAFQSAPAQATLSPQGWAVIALESCQ